MNCIKSGALGSRFFLFKVLCKDMDSDREILLYYISVRWLSKENVSRVFEFQLKSSCSWKFKGSMTVWLTGVMELGGKNLLT